MKIYTKYIINDAFVSSFWENYGYKKNQLRGFLWFISTFFLYFPSKPWKKQQSVAILLMIILLKIQDIRLVKYLNWIIMKRDCNYTIF